MKNLQLIGLIVFAAFFTGCETTEMTSNANGMGNQEAKRLAAIREEQRQPQPDESHKNLWNAEHDILTRDGKAIADY